MLNSVWGVVHEGKVQPLEEVNVPEGTKVLLTFLPEDESEFWLKASRSALDKIWDNAEDDRYAELLKG
jgi:hypothetical protein